MRPVAAIYKSSLLALKISESCAQVVAAGWVVLGFSLPIFFSFRSFLVVFFLFFLWRCPVGTWNGSPNLGQYRVDDRRQSIGGDRWGKYAGKWGKLPRRAQVRRAAGGQS